ncbi:hypothetical protein LTR56_000485 [Elasticomyces elasticus]|nr:hypothetical protein LTR22_014213 [Elasticomyces elasticus]KAK3660727.1 hypothetical protein LTR56_000485 [Elasticomyces elasticus]KAK4922873.1 hypothetical protein LTR49_009880 [Elasticomyces elasticus]KAK5759751.1 hypothetical protein LTS12_010091 [Elasticomyces elasticus]
MADKVAGDYFGRWANAEREVFELKNKLAKQQDIIAKFANGVITAGHDATSAEIILWKNESAMKQKQIEDLESSLRAKDTSRALEVEKLVAEIDGLKLELGNERVKQHEVTEVPGSKVEGDLEDGDATVLTPASSISEQVIDDAQGVEDDGLAQHYEEAIVTDPLVIRQEHYEQSTTLLEETPALVVTKPMKAAEVYKAYADELESLAERKGRSVNREADETAIEVEMLDMSKTCNHLLNTAVPEVLNTLDLDLGPDVLAQKLIEQFHEEIRAFQAFQRVTSMDRQKVVFDSHLSYMERRMLKAYQVEKYRDLESIIASIMEKLEAVLRA